MKNFTFTKSRRALLMMIAAAALCLVGCGGGDDNPSGGGSSGGGGGSGLVSMPTIVFGSIGESGGWWASDEWDGISGREGGFYIYSSIGLLGGKSNPYYGNQLDINSVRCVKD